jgi:hypothetical protein
MPAVVEGAAGVMVAPSLSNGAGWALASSSPRRPRRLTQEVRRRARYARGGVQEVLRELQDDRRFPGMQPVGVYPIHMVVRNGRTMLLGVVDNAADRQIAEVRAREVSGVFDVENSLLVGRERQESAVR